MAIFLELYWLKLIFITDEWVMVFSFCLFFVKPNVLKAYVAVCTNKDLF